MLILVIGGLSAQVFFSPRDAIYYMNDNLFGYILYGGIAFLFLFFLSISIPGLVKGLRAPSKWLGFFSLMVTVGALFISSKGLSDTFIVAQSLTQENCLKRIHPNADLSHCDLSGTNLSERDLRGANFEDADLSNANLTGSTLIGAQLLGSDLSNTNLSQADLSGANLVSAKLDNVTFEKAII